VVTSSAAAQDRIIQAALDKHKAISLKSCFGDEGNHTHSDETDAISHLQNEILMLKEHAIAYREQRANAILALELQQRLYQLAKDKLSKDD